MGFSIRKLSVLTVYFGSIFGIHLYTSNIYKPEFPVDKDVSHLVSKCYTVGVRI